VAKAKEYLTSYVIPLNDVKSFKISDKTGEKFNNTVKTFTTLKTMTDYSVKAEKELCLAIYFKKVDKVNFDYEVYAMRGKFRTIDTNKPSIVDVISVPDFFNTE